MSDIGLPDSTTWLLPANVAVAATVVCLVGLLAGRLLIGRPVPVRHGLLLAAIGLTLLCPAIVTVSSSLGLGVISVPVPVPVAVPQGEATPNSPPVFDSGEATAMLDSAFVSNANDVPMILSPLDGPELTTTSIGAPGADESRRTSFQPVRKNETGQVGNLSYGIIAILLTGWGGGLVWCLLRLARGMLLLRRLRKTISPVSDENVRSLGRSAFELAGVSRDTSLFESSRAPLPLTLGLFRPAGRSGEGAFGRRTVLRARSRSGAYSTAGPVGRTSAAGLFGTVLVEPAAASN